MSEKTTSARASSNELASAPSLLANLAAWPLEGSPVRSPWRLVAAAGALAEAISHIPLLAQSLSGTPYLGVGFLLLCVAGFLLAPLLIVNDTRTVWGLSIIVSALAIGGYVLSRSTGLPQFTSQIGNWGSPLGVVSIVGELMMLIPGVIQLASERLQP